MQGKKKTVGRGKFYFRLQILGDTMSLDDWFLVSPSSLLNSAWLMQSS